MIVFILSTVLCLVVITLCQPKQPQGRTRAQKSEQPYPYQYRHPEAAARYTRPQSTVRFK